MNAELYSQNQVEQMTKDLVQVLRDKGVQVGFAESCTGGLLSSLFTKVSGVSAVFKGAVVSYDNSIKSALLHVKEDTLRQHGAVSEACAKEMVQGALKVLNVDLAVAVTGIAGPNGGTQDKPVGTVFIALHGRKNEQDIKVIKYNFGDNIRGSSNMTAQKTLSREEIQLMTCYRAIEMMNNYLK